MTGECTWPPVARRTLTTLARAESLNRAPGIPAHDALTLIRLVDQAVEDGHSVDRAASRGTVGSRRTHAGRPRVKRAGR